ncbi:LOW QUALITY PROTEIN: hypothetical protein CVT26_008402 [Gymnopilus dilepis]|uniref:Uncharacterized protein n=1 Tax=Gymnopilus dilepis TaxID=231916 RepID=A0A409Y9N0_9AGAR|nr:LOW QUALITY PROTEIN: hypothetical protein CVT26_008402 [Gymnopilus dilepis]
MAESATTSEAKIPPAEADIVRADALFVVQETRKEGIFAGLTCGLASGEYFLIRPTIAGVDTSLLPLNSCYRIFSGLRATKHCSAVFVSGRSSLLNLNPVSTICLVSGILSGVLFTQAFRDAAMRKLREEHAHKRSESISENTLG